MKVTDYCPRAAPFDTYLKHNHKVGIEIGVDVGAHAHALLRYCSFIEQLILVDTWDNSFMYGFLQGRLHTHGYASKVNYLAMESSKAARIYGGDVFDFIYIDIPHDYTTVMESLNDWWPKLKGGGILGYRNYSTSNHELKKAVDDFLLNHSVVVNVEANEIIIRK